MRRTLALSLVLTLSLGLLSGCGPDTQAQELTAQPVSGVPGRRKAVPFSSLPSPQPWRSPWRPTERTGIP